eukprot:scaffold19260_cov112-Isochrysis_galbana.AAC.1
MRMHFPFPPSSSRSGASKQGAFILQRARSQDPPLTRPTPGGKRSFFDFLWTLRRGRRSSDQDS